MYKHGRGIAKDPVEAHFWYALAASQKCDDEDPIHGIAVRNRDDLETTLAASQVEDNERRVRDWKAKPRTENQ